MVNYDFRVEAAEETVWIYLGDKKAFKELKKADPRLDWAWRNNPPGNVKFSERPNKWSYCPYGKTRQEAADSANTHVQTEINRLEAQLVTLKAQLVKP
jgi:hypothetical protein